MIMYPAGGLGLPAKAAVIAKLSESPGLAALEPAVGALSRIWLIEGYTAVMVVPPEMLPPVVLSVTTIPGTKLTVFETVIWLTPVPKTELAVEAAGLVFIYTALTACPLRLRIPNPLPLVESTIKLQSAMTGKTCGA